MNDMDAKAQMLKFAMIADKVKEQIIDGKNRITVEDKNYAEMIMEKYKNNPEYKALLEKILNAPQGQSIQVVQEYFKEKQQQIEKKPEEEQIAKVFGVSADQIKHLYLKNGKQIFSFYSPDLGRDVVLENGRKGKTLTEVLKEIQESNEKYQSDDPNENSKDIMMDERLKSNLELPMYPPKEIGQHMGEIESLSANEKKLLKYLVDHAEQLDIKGINITNLIYIDHNHQIKEISFDKNFNPVTGSPEGEDNNTKEDKDSKSEINSMVSESNEKEESLEKQDKKKDVKKLILTNPNDLGYTDNIGWIIVVTCIITLTAITILRLL